MHFLRIPLKIVLVEYFSFFQRIIFPSLHPLSFSLLGLFLFFLSFFLSFPSIKLKLLHQIRRLKVKMKFFLLQLQQRKSRLNKKQNLRQREPFVEIAEIANTLLGLQCWCSLRFPRLGGEQKIFWFSFLLSPHSNLYSTQLLRPLVWLIEL